MSNINFFRVLQSGGTGGTPSPELWGDRVENTPTEYDYDNDVPAGFLRDGIYAKSDGSEIYILNNTDHKVYQWSMSTNHDLSTISYTGVSGNIETNWPSGTANGLFFNSSGTKLFSYGFTTLTLYAHTLSTAWDITSISLTVAQSVTFNITSTYNRVNQFAFTDDGKKLIIMAGTTAGIHKVRRYSFSTGFDLSTINNTSGDDTLDLSFTFPEFASNSVAFINPEDNTGDEFIALVKRDRGDGNKLGFDQYNGYSSTNVISYYEDINNSSAEIQSITNTLYMYTTGGGEILLQYDISST